METINFKHKYTTINPSKHFIRLGKIRVLCFFLGLIFLLIAYLASKELQVLYLVIAILLLLNAVMPRKDAYLEKIVSTELSYDGEKLKVIFNDIDELDGLGPRKEEFVMKVKGIFLVAYHKEEARLEIESVMGVKVKSSNDKLAKKRLPYSGRECYLELFLTEDEKYDVLAFIQKICIEHRIFVEDWI